MAQGLAHLDGASGAVEADHVNLHGAQDGEGGADFGARQHAAGEFDRHLHLKRHDAVERGHGPACPVDGRLGGQQIEDGLDQEEVDAAFEQAECLLLVGVAQVGVGDLSERGELGPGSHAPGHPARSLGRGELGGNGLGDLGTGAADLAGPVGQPVFGQHDGR